MFEKPNMEQRVQRMVTSLHLSKIRFVLCISCEIVELCFSALPERSTLPSVFPRSHLADSANASRKESQRTIFSSNSFWFSQSLVDIEAAAAAAELLVSIAFFFLLLMLKMTLEMYF